MTSVPTSSVDYDAVLIGGSDWFSSSREPAINGRRLIFRRYSDSFSELSASVLIVEWPSGVDSDDFQSFRNELSRLRQVRVWAVFDTPPTSADHELKSKLAVTVHFEQRPQDGSLETFVEKCLRQATAPSSTSGGDFAERGVEPAIFLDHAVKMLGERKQKCLPDVATLSECYDPLDQHYQTRISALCDFREKLRQNKEPDLKTACLDWVIASCLETEIQFLERKVDVRQASRPEKLRIDSRKAAIPEELLLGLVSLLLAGQVPPKPPQVSTDEEVRRCSLDFQGMPSFGRRLSASDQKVASSLSSLLASYGSRIEFTTPPDRTTLELVLT